MSAAPKPVCWACHYAGYTCTKQHAEPAPDGGARVGAMKALAAHEEARAGWIRAALQPVATPKVMHEDAPAAIIGEIGNQIHNLGCELQNDEDVSLRLSDLAIRLWDAAKLFATEPDALRAALDEAEARAVKAEAERDAANALLRRITRNVDADGVGTVLIIDLQAARAHLGAKP